MQHIWREAPIMLHLISMTNYKRLSDLEREEISRMLSEKRFEFGSERIPHHASGVTAG